MPFGCDGAERAVRAERCRRGDASRKNHRSLECAACALGAVVSAATVLINQPRGGAERNVSPAGRTSRDDRSGISAQNVSTRGHDGQTPMGGGFTPHDARCASNYYGAIAEICAVSRTGRPSGRTAGLNRISPSISRMRRLYPPSFDGLKLSSVAFPSVSTSKYAVSV